ncbi:MAG: hypothetical protein N4A72_05515 [Bacteroidales bacterium]|jgi:hypothetical protein|nr:hypothetical protein [Bacteroidales bacterium]
MYRETFNTYDNSGISITVELDFEELRVFEDDKLLYELKNESLDGRRRCNLSNGSVLEVAVQLRGFNVEVTVDGNLISYPDKNRDVTFKRLTQFMTIIGYIMIITGILDCITQYEILTKNFCFVTILTGAALLFTTNKLLKSKNQRFIIIYIILIAIYIPFSLTLPYFFQKIVVFVFIIMYLYRQHKVLKVFKK